MFDRLVGRTIFAQPDGVVGVDHDLAHLHQGGHADRIASVIREHHERGGVGDKAARQRDPVGDGRHAEFTHAVEQIVAALGGRDAFGALPPGEVRSGQVGRATQQFRQVRCQGFNGQLRGLTCGNRFGLGLRGGNEFFCGF